MSNDEVTKKMHQENIPVTTNVQFFQQYYDVLEQYVKFLRTNVFEQYTQTEQANTTLADAFK